VDQVQIEKETYCFRCERNIVIDNHIIDTEDSVVYSECPYCGGEVLKVFR